MLLGKASIVTSKLWTMNDVLYRGIIQDDICIGGTCNVTNKTCDSQRKIVKKVIYCPFFCSPFSKSNLILFIFTEHIFSSFHSALTSFYQIVTFSYHYTMLCTMYDVRIGFYIAKISFGVRKRNNDRTVAMLCNPICSMPDFK